MRISWITEMSPKWNYKCSYEGEEEELDYCSWGMGEQGDERTDWSDAARRKGMKAAASRKERS